MNVSTKQLRGFALAAKFGSFTKAAEHLHVTQAGLSAIIRELEAQFGSRLFDRTTRVLALTEAGQKLLPIALRTIDELEGAATEVQGIASRARRILRVGATPLVASRLLPAACAALDKSHPELTVQIVEIQRDVIQEQVLRGELDLGLGIFLKAAAGIERHRLLSSRLYCISPARAARATRAPRTVGSMRWSALKDVPLVGLQPDNPVQQLIERHLPVGEGTTARRYSVNHIETQIAMAEIGTGLAIIPSFALAACRSYAVEIAALRDPVVEMDFYRITKRGRLDAGPVDVFTSALAAVLKAQVPH